jgi:hypothetical protein
MEVNGGVFRGARAWSRRAWNLMGVGIRAVDRLVVVGLAKWEGDDLHVAHFDHESERAFLTQSERNRERSKRRWESPRYARGTPLGSPSVDARDNGDTTAARRPDQTQKRTEKIPPEPPVTPWPPKEPARSGRPEDGAQLRDLVNTLADAKQFPGTNGAGNR